MPDSTADVPETAPTGERFDPALMGGRLIEAEHFARYTWAAQFAKGKRVLDAACGMAYGTAMLAAAGAAETIGIDLDAEIVARVGSVAPAGTSFRVGDLRDLPFEDGEFDLVVCFEAIEHVPDPELVLDELARILGDNGLLLVSTPNRDVYTPGNPFHLRELTHNELASALESRFRSVSLRRQHTWIASAVLEDASFERGDNEPIDQVEVHKAGGAEVGTETYTIGMASDGDLPIGMGLVDLTADLDLREWSYRLDAADLALAAGAAPMPGQATAVEVELRQAEVTELRRQLVKGESEMARFADLEARLAAAHGALEEHESVRAQLGDLRGHYEALRAEHEHMVHSSSWRLTAPLRRLNSLLSSRS